MNTALSWIKAYVPELECGDQEYTDAMTLSGTKVETFERLENTATYDEGTRTITWYIDNIKANYSRSLSYKIRIGDLKEGVAKQEVQSVAQINRETEVYYSNALLVTAGKPIITVLQTTDTADTYVKYENGVITVESKMTEITPGSDVTYLATVGKDAPSSKADILYIAQVNNSEGKPHTFTYTISGDQKDLIGKIHGYIKYGSDNPTVAEELNDTEDAKKIQVNEITVTYDADHIEAIEEVYVGAGANTTIAVAVKDGYQVTGVKINGKDASEDVVASLRYTVPYADAPTLEIKTAEVVAPMKLDEVPATFTAEKLDGTPLSTIGMVVKVSNMDENVSECGIYVADSEDNALKLSDEDIYGGYYPAVVNDDGYYAVNVVSEADLKGYTVKPYYVIDSVKTIVEQD